MLMFVLVNALLCYVIANSRLYLIDGLLERERVTRIIEKLKVKSYCKTAGYSNQRRKK